MHFVDFLVNCFDCSSAYLTCKCRGKGVLRLVTTLPASTISLSKSSPPSITMAVALSFPRTCTFWKNYWSKWLGLLSKTFETSSS